MPTAETQPCAVPWLLLGSLTGITMLVAGCYLEPFLNWQSPWWTLFWAVVLLGVVGIAAGLWCTGRKLWQVAALCGLAGVLTLLGLKVLTLFAFDTPVMWPNAVLQASWLAWGFTPLVLGVAEAWQSWRQKRPRWLWLLFAFSPAWGAILLSLPSLINPAWHLPASPEDVGDTELVIGLFLLPWLVLARVLQQNVQPKPRRPVQLPSPD